MRERGIRIIPRAERESLSQPVEVAQAEATPMQKEKAMAAAVGGWVKEHQANKESERRSLDSIFSKDQSKAA